MLFKIYCDIFEMHVNDSNLSVLLYPESINAINVHNLCEREN